MFECCSCICRTPRLQCRPCLNSELWSRISPIGSRRSLRRKSWRGPAMLSPPRWVAMVRLPPVEAGRQSRWLWSPPGNRRKSRARKPPSNCARCLVAISPRRLSLAWCAPNTKTCPKRRSRNSVKRVVPRNWADPRRRSRFVCQPRAARRLSAERKPPRQRRRWQPRPLRLRSFAGRSAVLSRVGRGLHARWYLPVVLSAAVRSGQPADVPGSR